MTSTRVESLETPAFLIHRRRLENNTRLMREKAARSEIFFRPHVKTHKTEEIARLQHGGVAGPITVSTLAEAEFFLDRGFGNITYAVPVSPQKLARAAMLARRAEQLNVLIDHRDALQALESFGEAESVVFDVFLKVDCGYHRAGVDPQAPESVSLARALSEAKHANFRGLLTHAGHSYHARTRSEILEIAAQEAAVLTTFREVLSGNANLLRSIGSTPTAAVVDRFPEADEARPGNYVFFDAFQAALGACEPHDCACAVLTTVVGHYPGQRKIIVDAGALALSKDLGAVHIDPGSGFGVVCDLEWNPLPLRIVAVSQEHGQVLAASSAALPPIGSRFLIVPNHSCLTAALFDEYFVVGDGEVETSWRPARGW